MDFSKITTDLELIKLLERASKRNLTADEIQKQRASFVWGQLPDDHPMSKADVEAHLSGFKSIDQINEERLQDWRRQMDELKTTNITVTHGGETASLPPTKLGHLDRRVAETIRDLSDDGFSPTAAGRSLSGGGKVDVSP